MVLAGPVTIESMGFEPFGFAGGCRDGLKRDDAVDWRPGKEPDARKRFDEAGVWPRLRSSVLGVLSEGRSVSFR